MLHVIDAQPSPSLCCTVHNFTYISDATYPCSSAALSPGCIGRLNRIPKELTSPWRVTGRS